MPKKKVKMSELLQSSTAMDVISAFTKLFLDSIKSTTLAI